MPEEFGKCRLQLMIEYNRLLAWGDAVGLVRAAHGSDIAASLGTNANELCAIVARIGGLLEEFRELNNRWQNEATLDPASELAVTGAMAAEIDFSAKVSGLALIHTEKLEERRKTKRMKRLAAWASKGAATANRAIAHPSRVRWVLADKHAFEVLLVDLHKLIDRIHELMDTYQKRQIQETTAKTYLEMVILQNDLRDIKDMFQAVVSMMEVSKRSCSTTPDWNETTHETLRDLLLLKEIKCVSDEILSRLHDDAALDVKGFMDDAIKVNQYDDILFNDCFTPNTSGFIANGVDPHRPRGFLNQKGANHEVWVEWRTVEYQMNGSVEEKECIVRTATLAAMPQPGLGLKTADPGMVIHRSESAAYTFIDCDSPIVKVMEPPARSFTAFAAAMGDQYRKFIFSGRSQLARDESRRWISNDLAYAPGQRHPQGLGSCRLSTRDGRFLDEVPSSAGRSRLCAVQGVHFRRHDRAGLHHRGPCGPAPIPFRHQHFAGVHRQRRGHGRRGREIAPQRWRAVGRRKLELASSSPRSWLHRRCCSHIRRLLAAQNRYQRTSRCCWRATCRHRAG